MQPSWVLSLFLLTQRWTTLTMARKIAAKSDDPQIIAQRLGRPDQARPDGPLIWVHLCSDGGATAILELVHRCRDEREELNFLLTTSGQVSASVFDGLLPDGVQHQRVPADHSTFVDGFLDHWRPDVCVFTEDEIRVSLMVAVKARGLPLYLLDGRMTPERQSRWRWVPGMPAAVLRLFDRLFVVDDVSARRFQQLGASEDAIEVTGVLEEGTAALPCDEDERDRLGAHLSSRPVWLAAYAGATEIDVVIQAHRRVMRHSHRLLLILVPQAGQDAAALAGQWEREGWNVARRALDQDPDEETHILIADVPGEMGLWYRLAPITFLGGSLGSGTGRNPFEPAALGSAILHGPSIRSFRASFDRLTTAGAARQISNVQDLSDEVERLLAPDKAAEMAHAAWMVCSSGAEVTDRVKDLLFDAIDVPRSDNART